MYLLEPGRRVPAPLSGASPTLGKLVLYGLATAGALWGISKTKFGRKVFRRLRRKR